MSSWVDFDVSLPDDGLVGFGVPADDLRRTLDVLRFEVLGLEDGDDGQVVPR